MSLTQERRRTRRRGAGEHGATARIRPGHQVQVIDLSSGGALVEADRRMLPGSAVELQLQAQDRQATMRGSVLRCCVVRVPTGVNQLSRRDCLRSAAGVVWRRAGV